MRKNDENLKIYMRKWQKNRRDKLRLLGLCWCGETAKIGQTRCIKCASKNVNRMMKLHQKWRLSGLCKDCGSTKAPKYEVCDSCRTNRAIYCRDKALKVKIEVLNKYGGCACTCTGCSWHQARCIVDDVTILTMDHINNDGAKHRKDNPEIRKNIYHWIKKNNFPPGFQILCYNCNLAKYYSIRHKLNIT